MSADNLTFLEIEIEINVLSWSSIYCWTILASVKSGSYFNSSDDVALSGVGSQYEVYELLIVEVCKYHLI